MSEPKRLLLDPNASPLQKELLAAWDREQPSPRARESTLVALGLAATVATGAATATASGHVAATTAAAGPLPPKAIVGGIAWAKWVGIGLLGVAGATTVAVRSSSKRPAAPAVVQPGASSSTQVPSSMPPVRAPIAQLPRDMSENAPTDSSRVASAAPSASSLVAASSGARSPLPSASLAEQLAELDRARSALDDGNFPLARQLVNAYEARHPAGAFVQEAEALRIQALVREGDRAQAERVAARFRAAHPKSPHLARIDALLSSPR